MNDSADPLTSWSLEEVLHTSSGPATADVYGKLLFYLREQLHSFLNRIQNLRIRLMILNFNPKDLPDRVEKDFYSRIEVSEHPTITKARYRIKPPYLRTFRSSTRLNH